MNVLRYFLVVIVSAAVASCAMAPLPAPQASIDNLQTIRAAGIAPVKLGDFTLAPGLSDATDKSIAIRAMTVAAPGGSFTGYLRDTLRVELQAGGKLDPNSTIVVSGQLTRSVIDAGMSDPHAILGAIFVVTRDGNEVYRKPLEVRTRWTGDFLGGIAIPEADKQYTALYAKLVSAFLSDGDFKVAAQPH
ncbi:MAG: hypothetical protein HY243_01700 [Proteobacteria bacterium]|nr:hypothetical protein [Pseudomonadota bacterium]